MGEEAHRASGDKIKRLQKSIQEKGYDILVHVREDGVPFIVEGNTRVAEAIESGRIPVEIKYLRGAETVDESRKTFNSGVLYLYLQKLQKCFTLLKQKTMRGRMF
jgi:hypothetical protein